MGTIRDAIPALFGRDSLIATEQHVRDYLSEEEEIDRGAIKDQWSVKEEQTFLKDPAAYIQTHAADPRVRFWQRIQEMDDEDNSEEAEEATDPKLPARSLPRIRSPRSGQDRGVQTQIGVNPVRPAVTVQKPLGAVLHQGAARPVLQESKRERAQVQDRPVPEREAGREPVSPEMEEVLKSESYRGFYDGIIADFDGLDTPEKERAQTNLDLWERQARQYRDGQVRNCDLYRAIGNHVLRLMEALGQNEDRRRLEWFGSHFHPR